MVISGYKAFIYQIFFHSDRVPLSKPKLGVEEFDFELIDLLNDLHLSR